ncbi:hypothetical protein [Streptomyces sp. NPDC056242]|uniref:hypothetical protein n=1 Tax=unclassified Streptomyces TaxID=2593676 RepID=UPI0035E05EA2
MTELADDGIIRHLRKVYRGTVIANVGFDQQQEDAIIAENLANLVAYGQPALHRQPRLPVRFASNALLTEPKTDLDHGPDDAGCARADARDSAGVRP